MKRTYEWDEVETFTGKEYVDILDFRRFFAVSEIEGTVVYWGNG